MTEIIRTEQVSVITFGGIPAETENEFIMSVFKAACEESINIDMISKAYLSTDCSSVGFSVSDEVIPCLIKAFKTLKLQKPPMISCGNVKIVIKSKAMIDEKGFALSVFSLLDSLRTIPLLITTAVDEISFIIRETESEEVERRLKKLFGKK